MQTNDIRRQRWACALILAGAVAGRACPAADAVPPTFDPAAMAALLDQGQADLSAGNFDDAQTVFAKAVALSSTCLSANRGLGFARLRLGDLAHALTPLKAAQLKTVGVPDRSLTLALAAAYVGSDQPLPAAKAAMAYLKGHATPLDEPVVNALGIALNKASLTGSLRLSDTFKDGTEEYRRQNAALEAARPGQRRWGVTWVTPRVFNRRNSDYQSAQRAVTDITKHIADLERDEQAAVDREHVNANKLGYTNRYQQQYQIRVDRNIADEKESEAKVAEGDLAKAKQTLAETMPPDYPSSVPTDGIVLSVTPVVATGGTATIWADKPVAGGGGTGDTSVPSEGAADSGSTAAPAVSTESTDAPGRRGRRAGRGGGAVEASADGGDAGAASTAVDWSSAGRFVGQSKTFTGTVVAMEKRRDGFTYLAIGADFKLPGRLVVQLPGRQPAGGGGVESTYVGKRVTVKGSPAALANGFRIKLIDLADLVVLE
jgi:hypothetical protein